MGESLEPELSDNQVQNRSLRNNTKTPVAAADQNQSDFLHSDLISGLDYISNKSAETLNGLGEEQIALREKQDLIINKSGELLQSAENILDVSRPEGNESKELCNIKQLVQGVLNEFFQYAQSRGVSLRPDLDDVEPILIYKYQTLRALKNVVHNAIKYSFRGGVVEVKLTLVEGEQGAAKMISTEVKDTGKGIKEEDQEKIFALHKREDGLIEPGNGLGLYLAREAVRRQDGDVILVISTLNQGSIFEITLPYGDD